MKALKTALLSLVCITLFTACASLDPVKRQGVSSSLVDYLYPDGEIPSVSTEDKPVLKLPLRIGLAFVPPSQHYRKSPISEKQKIELLEKVKGQFEQYPFIEHITVIPESYLNSRRGFTTVEQVSRLYGVDIVALVSYDQIIFRKNNIAAITYWTIVGAYFVPGDQQRVDTFVDTAVFDIRTRKLLFRAPGINSQSDISRLINVETERVRISQKSFGLAMNNMSENLDTELKKFKERVKESDAINVKIRKGYTASSAGAGSSDALLLLLMALLYIASRQFRATNQEI